MYDCSMQKVGGSTQSGCMTTMRQHNTAYYTTTVLGVRHSTCSKVTQHPGGGAITDWDELFQMRANKELAELYTLLKVKPCWR
jgi:hypothetical protein